MLAASHNNFDSSEHGKTMVEFAIVAGIFFGVFLMLVDLFTLGWNWAGIRYSAQEGMRQVILGPAAGETNNSGLITRAQNRARDAAAEFGITGVTPVAAVLPTNSLGAWATVTVSKPVTSNIATTTLLRILDSQAAQPANATTVNLSVTVRGQVQLTAGGSQQYQGTFIE